jgi:alpha-tubulin suppressor-like RCC1 family protein
MVTGRFGRVVAAGVGLCVALVGLAAPAEPASAATSDTGPGAVWAWGNNWSGQLGNGTTDQWASAPVEVGIADATAVAAGLMSGYALRADGTVWAWGENEHGQLGDGSTADSSEPVQVTQLAGVTAIASKGDAAYALLGDGTVWAWGSDYAYQLGIYPRTTYWSSVPVRVWGLTGITAIAAGRLSLVAVRSDGTVWGLGENGSGTLGDACGGATCVVPTQLSGLTDVTKVVIDSVGGYALRSDGTVWAWGSNSYGRRGDGATTWSPTPTQVSGLSGVTAIAAGQNNGYAVGSDGTLWAWGRAINLGTGTTTDSNLPVRVDGLADVRAVASAGEVVSVLLADGSVWLWGNGSAGQFGKGLSPASRVPAKVSGLTGITAVATGALAQYALAGLPGEPPLSGGGYAALGDSFQSGQGAGDYEPGTDEGDGNGCRRSFNAYAHRLVADGAVNLTLDFRACNGAVMADFYNTQHRGTDTTPFQGPQLLALGPDTKLVTIGIVGNNLDFSGTLKNCIYTASGNVIVSIPLTWWRSCARNQGAGVDAKIASLQSGQLHTDLLALYRSVRYFAPNARVIVVDYPQFFQADGSGGYPGCQGIRSSDQVWINEKIRQADEAIDATATEAGFEHVSMTDVLAGHAECTSDPGINGIRATDLVASFHPNSLGHQLMASRIEDHLRHPINPTFVIRSQETVRTHYEIRGSVLTLNIGWPGSNVVTTLISPSGVRYTRDAPAGAEHGAGPTWEYFTITDPEPGDWTVESYGADVAAGGEPVTYVLSDKVATNQPPTAVVTTTRDGDTFTFDATASTDPDGTIVDYQWEFADGTYAAGPVVTHTFAPGTYDVTLVTTDNQGAKGFGYTDQVIHVGSVITGSTVYSGSSLQVTNDVNLSGPDANLIVAGDLECNSHGHIGGDVTVAGGVHLTNKCRIDGSLTAGGAVSMDSTSSVGGDLTAVGAVRFQSTGHIGGKVTTGAMFTVIDRATVTDLIESGVLGGPVTTHAAVPAPNLGPAPVVGAKTLQVDQESTWAQWLHHTAVAAGAPSWSAGLSTHPGCALASWTVGTSTVAVDATTRIDATKQTTGCSSVSLFGLSLKLSGDLTIVADGVQSTNGLHVTSADGLPHTLRILVPGQIDGAQRAHAVSLLGGTTVDPMITVEIGTPGTVSLSGGVDMVAQIAAGHINADGHVTLTSTGS